MLSGTRLGRVGISRVLASGAARTTAASVQSTSGIIYRRLQSTQTSSSSETTERETDNPDGPTVRKFKSDEAYLAARDAIMEKLNSGSSTEALFGLFIQRLDKLNNAGSRARLGAAVLVPIMERAIAEINAPNQTQIIPSPQELLNKSLLYQAAPREAFVFVARNMFKEEAPNDILSLWVSFLEYKAETGQKTHYREQDLVKLATLAYIESCSIQGVKPDMATLESLLQTSAPSQGLVFSELNKLLPNRGDRYQKIRRTIRDFFLSKRDPNSVTDLTNAHEAALAGRAAPVFAALGQARDIAKASGKPLTEDTLVAFMKMLTQVQAAGEATKLWNEIIQAGITPSQQAWNALLLAVSKTGRGRARLGQAEAVLQKMPTRDDSTYATLIQIYVQAKRFDLVEEVAKDKLTHPIISQAYLQAVASEGNKVKFESTLAKLKEMKIPFTIATYNSILSFHVRTKNYDAVYPVMDEIIAAGVTPDIATYTILIDFTLKTLRDRGELPTEEVFDSFFSEVKRFGLEVNEFTLTAIMDGLSKAGAIRSAQDLFNHLQKTNKATIVTYISIITAEFSKGRVAEAESHFKEMLSEGYSVRPTHWAALFEGFSQNGRDKSALEYLNALDQNGMALSSLNKFSYYFLLRCALDKKNFELAEKVFEILEKNKSEGVLSPKTLFTVKELKDAGVEIPEALNARL